MPSPIHFSGHDKPTLAAVTLTELDISEQLDNSLTLSETGVEADSEISKHN